MICSSVIGQYDGILAGDDHLTREVIEAAPTLKVISKWGVGLDSIDLEAAAEHGVTVLNTPGMFGDELADYALGFLILLARRQHEVDREVRAGKWHKPRGHSLAGRILGIVGLGSSGSALAARALVMKMEVVAVDPLLAAEAVFPGVRRVEFDQLLEVSDVISLHVPVLPETRSLISDGRYRTDEARGMAHQHLAWRARGRGCTTGRPRIGTGRCSGSRCLQAGTTGAELIRSSLHPNVIVGAHNGSNTEEAVAGPRRRPSRT